jgi:hypothetical protein
MNAIHSSAQVTLAAIARPALHGPPGEATPGNLGISYNKHSSEYWLPPSAPA